MKKPKHMHKYERGKLGDSYEIYRCVLTECTHYIPLSLADGKLSLCWGNCGNAVMLDKQMINQAKTKRPICDSCKEIKRKQREFLLSIPNEEQNAKIN
jgi:hypothetical protein